MALNFKKIGLIALLVFTAIACQAAPLYDSSPSEYDLLEEGFVEKDTGWENFGSFAGSMFKTFIFLSIVIAVIALVSAGMQYVLSSTTLWKKSGKDWAWSAILGLLLALTAWLILYTINPEILNWKQLNPPGNESGS